jgi:hypothetical protein
MPKKGNMFNKKKNKSYPKIQTGATQFDLFKILQPMQRANYMVVLATQVR